jgi:hypothetical protein
VVPLLAIADPLEQMIGAERSAAMGLAKLTPEERAELARWLEQRLADRPEPVAIEGTMAPVQVQPALFGAEQTQVEGALATLSARIVGEFTGWEGKTIFTLDNGQVWRQSTGGVYRHRATDPAVTIERGAFGYKLRLTETKRSIAVRRIK